MNIKMNIISQVFCFANHDESLVPLEIQYLLIPKMKIENLRFYIIDRCILLSGCCILTLSINILPTHVVRQGMSKETYYIEME